MTHPASGAFAARPARDRKPDTSNHDRYERIDRLGSGGMGVVWRARDTWLERDVALKTVPERDPHLEQRLEREWRVAVRIRSEGCIRVLDRGTLDDGRPFVVTELLHTPALDPESDPQTRIQVLIEVCRAIGDAHRQGIVHRDLKPSNLGLRRTTDGEPRRAVVFDWGLAKPTEDAEHAAEGWSERVIGPPLTMSGMVTGTVGYMAPEQLANGRIRSQSDVWSLAAMLHEVLTGRSPCTDGTHTLLAAISKGAIDIPDPAFEALLRRALSLEPDERPSDGHALADAIAAIVAPPVSAPRSPRRRSLGLGIAGICGAATLLGVGFLQNPAPSTADEATTDALHAVHVQLGDALAAQGRFEEARRHGLEADGLRSTPDSRGLLTFPAAPPPDVQPLACESAGLFPALQARTCKTASDLEVVRSRGAKRHRIDAEIVWPLHDGLMIQRGLEMIRIAADGSEQVLGNAQGEHLVASHPDGRVAWTTGPRVSTAAPDARTTIGPTAPTHIDTLVITPTEVVLTADRSVYVLEGDTLRELATLSGQPAVAAAHVGPDLVFVGLRGEVLVLDATTLQERDRYRLRGVAQVPQAAIERRRIAIANEAGVRVFQSGEPELQLDLEPVDSLMWTADDTLQALREGALYTWSLDDALSLVVPSRGSTTALRLGLNPAIAAQPPDSNDARVYRFEPDRLISAEIDWARSNDGVVRSIPLYGLMVENQQAYRVGRDGTREPLGVYPVLAAIGDAHAIGVRRWGRGFGVFTPEGDLHVSDAPTLRTAIPSTDGEHALAVSAEGQLYQLGLDGSITALTVDGHVVDGVGEVFAEGGAGLAVGRGSDVELVGTWTATCRDTITALAVDGQHVAVGTHSGHVCVFDADGTLARRFRAHPERVNTLGFWSGWLFSGSWAPGVRRWAIDQSWSTSSSPG